MFKVDESCMGVEHIETLYKNRTIKISNIPKDFELYQIFKHNFLCQSVPIFPLYYCFEESINFGLHVSSHFGLNVNLHFTYCPDYLTDSILCH